MYLFELHTPILDLLALDIGGLEPNDALFAELEEVHDLREGKLMLLGDVEFDIKNPAHINEDLNQGEARRAYHEALLCRLVDVPLVAEGNARNLEKSSPEREYKQVK